MKSLFEYLKEIYELKTKVVNVIKNKNCNRNSFCYFKKILLIKY